MRVVEIILILVAALAGAGVLPRAVSQGRGSAITRFTRASARNERPPVATAAPMDRARWRMASRCAPRAPSITRTG